jgi:hypothetical protein
MLVDAPESTASYRPPMSSSDLLASTLPEA